MKLLSIIIPAYNCGKYIGTCLDSIINQPYKNIEIIIINDGSLDDTLQIANEYANKYSNIKVLSKKNEGQAIARNIGLDNASGEYIGFVDADDYVDESMFETLIGYIESDDVDIAACNFCGVKDNQRFTNYIIKEGASFPNIGYITMTREESLNELPDNKMLTYSPCNKIYKRKLFEGLRFVEGRIFEDLDISYKLIARSNKISYTIKELYYYAYNPESTMNKKYNLKRADEYLAVSEMYKYYSENNIKGKEKVLQTLFMVGFVTYTNIMKHFPDKVNQYEYLLSFSKEQIKLLRKNKLDMKTRVALEIFNINKHLLCRIYKHLLP